MGCAASYPPNAHQPQAGGSGGAAPRQAPSATVVSPQSLPRANAQQVGGAQQRTGQADNQKSAPILKSLVQLHRDSLQWEGDASSSSLSFKFDTSSSQGCKVTAHLFVQENTSGDGAVPSFLGAKQTQQETFRQGLQQTCQVTFSGVDAAAGIASHGEEKDGFYHLVVDIAAVGASGLPVVMTRQLSYAKLAKSDAGCTLSLVKQKAVAGAICSELETLYGAFGRIKNNDAGGDGTDCVICLTNPRDTVIMPCRHVCLCSNCANVTSSTWSFQCPVCRARVAAMVKLQD